MENIILREGTTEAEFDWGNGLSLVRFRTKDGEVKDCAKIIGPHFGRRIPDILPKEAQREGKSDPFPHGIARYAPWSCQVNESSLSARISGKDLFRGVPLKNIQGQDFTMLCDVKLMEEALSYELSVVSESDSLIGLEWILDVEQATVQSDVKNLFYASNEIQQLHPEWKTEEMGFMKYAISPQEKTDFVFHPFFDPLRGKITYQTNSRSIRTEYESHSQEISWHLSHEVGAKSFSISPVSSQNPWRPNLTVSSIHISIVMSK